MHTHWDRRSFLKLLGLSAVTSALPSSWGCGTTPESPAIALAETGPVLLPNLPTSLLNVDDNEVDLPLNVISGTLPTDIEGHMFVVAAIPWNDGSMIFNGNGLMYRLDLGTKTPMLKSRIAKSPCYWADEATKDTSLGFVNAGITRLGKLGVRNELNTAFMPFGDRLLVTYDGGRPWEVDVNSLELITPIGGNDQWQSSIPFLQGPFKAYLSTAHPFWDSHTEQMFSVNYGQQLGEANPPFTNILRWDKDGTFQRWSLIQQNGTPVSITQSAHQLAVTQDFVIIVDCAFFVENEQILDPTISHPQSSNTLLYIVKRSDLKADVQEVQVIQSIINRESVHLCANYDNPNDEITLYIAHNTASDASEWLRDGDTLYNSKKPVKSSLHGFVSNATDINFVGKHTINASSGKVIGSNLTMDKDYTWGVAFFTHHHQTPDGPLNSIFFNSVGFTEETLISRVVEMYADYPHRTISLDQLPDNKQGALFHFDAQSASIVDAYLFPPGRAGSSPQFVPKPNASSDKDGYLVTTVVSDDTSWSNSSGDEFWIFDAQNLSQGPITRLGHPKLSLGFTLHTAFLPSLQPRQSSYKLNIKDDYLPLLTSQPDDIKSLFEEHIFSRFT